MATVKKPAPARILPFATRPQPAPPAPQSPLTRACSSGIEHLTRLHAQDPARVVLFELAAIKMLERYA